MCRCVGAQPCARPGSGASRQATLLLPPSQRCGVVLCSGWSRISQAHLLQLRHRVCHELARALLVAEQVQGLCQVAPGQRGGGMGALSQGPAGGRCVCVRGRATRCSTRRGDQTLVRTHRASVAVGCAGPKCSSAIASAFACSSLPWGARATSSGLKRISMCMHGAHAHMLAWQACMHAHTPHTHACAAPPRGAPCDAARRPCCWTA